jgi:hypothetical protein
LLLQRLAQIVRALAQLVQQPRVLDATSSPSSPTITRIRRHGRLGEPRLSQKPELRCAVGTAAPAAVVMTRGCCTRGSPWRPTAEMTLHRGDHFNPRIRRVTIPRISHITLHSGFSLAKRPSGRIPNGSRPASCCSQRSMWANLASRSGLRCSMMECLISRRCTHDR